MRYNGGSEGEVVIPKLDLTAPDANTMVIFDAYVLESRETVESENYHYIIDLSYGEDNGYYIASKAAVSTIDGFNEEFSGTSYFAIQNNNGQKRFLRNDSEQKVGTKQIDIDGVTESFKSEYPWEYVWKFEKDSGSENCYNIRSAQGPAYNYMLNPETNPQQLLLGVDDLPWFELSQNANGLCMKSMGNSQYVNVNGGNQDVVMGWKNADGGSTFLLYPLKEGYIVPLSTIDPVTSQVRPVREIRRNDFISVLVTVSYNSHDGSFSFKALPWTVKDKNHIEFN